jgi:hypothetical protein
LLLCVTDVTTLELQDLGIRCQIGQRRKHGVSAVSQLPPAPPPAQNLPPGAVAAACRRGGRQLGAWCGSLVVERNEPATHGRHSRPRVLAEPGATSARVAERPTRSSRRRQWVYDIGGAPTWLCAQRPVRGAQRRAEAVGDAVGHDRMCAVGLAARTGMADPGLRRSRIGADASAGGGRGDLGGDPVVAAGRPAARPGAPVMHRVATRYEPWADLPHCWWHGETQSWAGV